MSESRQANPILEIPLDAPRDASSALWTPDGLEHIQSWVCAREPASGRFMVKHEFRLTWKG